MTKKTHAALLFWTWNTKRKKKNKRISKSLTVGKKSSLKRPLWKEKAYKSVKKSQRG
jgi:hypothetical protein